MRIRIRIRMRIKMRIRIRISFSVGYVFSNSIGIRNFTDTYSHEFLLRYEFNPRAFGVLRSPRIF